MNDSRLCRVETDTADISFMGYLSYRDGAALLPHSVSGGHTLWLFSDTVKGARSSANLYSLIETAKANGLEPYAYLRRGIILLPAATTVADIEALLPWASRAADRLNVVDPFCSTRPTP